MHCSSSSWTRPWLAAGFGAEGFHKKMSSPQRIQPATEPSRTQPPTPSRKQLRGPIVQNAKDLQPRGHHRSVFVRPWEEGGLGISLGDNLNSVRVNHSAWADNFFIAAESWCSWRRVFTDVTVALRGVALRWKPKSLKALRSYHTRTCSEEFRGSAPTVKGTVGHWSPRRWRS